MKEDQKIERKDNQRTWLKAIVNLCAGNGPEHTWFWPWNMNNVCPVCLGRIAAVNQQWTVPDLCSELNHAPHMIENSVALWVVAGCHSNRFYICWWFVKAYSSSLRCCWSRCDVPRSTGSRHGPTASLCRHRCATWDSRVRSTHGDIWHRTFPMNKSSLKARIEVLQSFRYCLSTCLNFSVGTFLMK